MEKSVGVSDAHEIHQPLFFLQTSVDFFISRWVDAALV